MSIWGLRWKLARKFAPVPIMRKLGDAEGAYVFVHGKDDTWTITYYLDRMKVRSFLAPLDEKDPLEFAAYRRHQVYITARVAR